MERAAECGLHPQMASELELFLFRETYDGAREKGYRNLVTSQQYNEDYHVLSGSFAEPVIGAIRRIRTFLKGDCRLAHPWDWW